MVRMPVVGAMLAARAVAAAPAADPVTGTWKPDVARSQFSPGAAPKARIRTYAESAQGTVLTLKTTAADGRDATATLTFTDDGKPHPATGDPDFDAVAVTRVDALTVRTVQMKAAATVGAGARTFSQDGKTLTFAQQGRHASGAKYDNVSVYDRQ